MRRRRPRTSSSPVVSCRSTRTDRRPTSSSTTLPCIYWNTAWGLRTTTGVTSLSCRPRFVPRAPEIRLASDDPHDAPVIDPDYLAAEGDIEPLREGVRLARELARTDALADYCGEEVHPGEAVTSDEEIEAFVREHATTVYHPAGTCKMGTDEMAVVDDELRVRGVEGLRVVDASIMPRIVGGNTNAPTIAIAEKAADLIAP